MEEHEEEISSVREEGNRGHAAGTISVKHGVDLSHLMTSSKDSIFRIPGLLKMRNEQACTPYKFSIGPWHFGKTQLLRTGQKSKESFLEGLINRFPDPAAKKRQLEDAIKIVHDKARECYEGGDVYEMRENKDVAKQDFEKILLLDGCFIIELFRKNAEKERARNNEFLFFSEGMIQAIYHDLLLLENQIPWFVLELLFDRTREYSQYRNLTLEELTIEFFSGAISHCELYELQSLQLRHNSNILHLVDFVWRFLCFSSATEKLITTFEYKTLIPSASRLKEAGVKFQKAESKNILDVEFNKGVLEIPHLLITPSTETIFRNLIIFEQCSLPYMPRVTSYAVLLDCLVDTSDDVDLMCRAGILNNWLNPEETANFLNRVRDNTPIQWFLYAQLCADVNSYCERRWPRWRASLIQNYFTKPWAIVSVVFATIALFFTIMQVFYK